MTRATGQEPARSEKIVGGYQNEVHCIETRQSLYWKDQAAWRFEQEAWGMEACRAVGVPVPEILLLERIQDGEGVSEVIGRFLAVAALIGILMMVN